MVSSNLLLALMAGTASACKYRLYAAQQGTTGAYANVSALEFAIDSTTKIGTLKEIGASDKCGQQPTWQTLSTGPAGETIVECIDEAWARDNGSITPLIAQEAGTFTDLKINFTLAQSPVHIEPLSLESGEYRYISNFMFKAPGITALKKSENGSYTIIQDVKLTAGVAGSASQIHQTIVHPSGEFLIAEDYGLGAHKVYSIDQATGKLTFLKDEKTQKGIRHGVFTSPGNEFCNETTFFHAVNEFNNTIESYKVSSNPDGQGLIFDFLGNVTTFPGRTANKTAAAAEIVESDGFIIASNRLDPYLKVPNPDTTNSTAIASDALVSYKIGEDGKLTAGELFPSGGEFPRHFSLPSDDGSFIAVAHVISKSVTIFERDTETGKIGKSLASIVLPNGIAHIAWGEQVE